MTRPHALIPASLAILLLAAAAAAFPPPEAAEREVPAGWLERLPRTDRAFVDALRGRPMPALREELTWPAGTPLDGEALRGHIVVLHTWTSASGPGRRVPARMAELHASLRSIEDLEVLLVHTPQGAGRVDRYLENREIALPLVVDPKGAFCDELGAYKRPVSFIVDRTGVVRYAGLNDTGLEEAVRELALEPYEPGPAPPATNEPAPGPKATFPPYTGRVSNATDRRGQPGPVFHVQQWVTDRAPVGDLVTVYDFWATWCGPCRMMIPHMNELAESFRGRVAIVGVSNESNGEFANGMRRTGLRLDGFQYALAVDPSGRMMRYFGVAAIPHCAVVSRDGIVRWQGSPASLSRAVLEEIVAADAALLGPATTETVWPRERYRWTRQR